MTASSRAAPMPAQAVLSSFSSTTLYDGCHRRTSVVRKTRVVATAGASDGASAKSSRRASRARASIDLGARRRSSTASRTDPNSPRGDAEDDDNGRQSRRGQQAHTVESDESRLKTADALLNLLDRAKQERKRQRAEILGKIVQKQKECIRKRDTHHELALRQRQEAEARERSERMAQALARLTYLAPPPTHPTPATQQETKVQHIETKQEPTNKAAAAVSTSSRAILDKPAKQSLTSLDEQRKADLHRLSTFGLSRKLSVGAGGVRSQFDDAWLAKQLQQLDEKYSFVDQSAYEDEDNAEKIRDAIQDIYQEMGERQKVTDKMQDNAKRNRDRAKVFQNGQHRSHKAVNDNAFVWHSAVKFQAITDSPPVTPPTTAVQQQQQSSSSSSDSKPVAPGKLSPSRSSPQSHARSSSPLAAIVESSEEAREAVTPEPVPLEPHRLLSPLIAHVDSVMLNEETVSSYQLHLLDKQGALQTDDYTMSLLGHRQDVFGQDQEEEDGQSVVIRALRKKKARHAVRKDEASTKPAKEMQRRQSLRNELSLAEQMMLQTRRRMSERANSRLALDASDTEPLAARSVTHSACDREQLLRQQQQHSPRAVNVLPLWRGANTSFTDPRMVSDSPRTASLSSFMSLGPSCDTLYEARSRRASQMLRSFTPKSAQVSGQLGEVQEQDGDGRDTADASPSVMNTQLAESSCSLAQRSRSKVVNWEPLDHSDCAERRTTIYSGTHAVPAQSAKLKGLSNVKYWTLPG
ncbi:hypothetical protein RI367_004928 [Sorochytrium milnesiophthora]